MPILQNSRSNVLLPSTLSADARRAASAAPVKSDIISTTVVERLLLTMVIAILPIEKYVPRIGPVSVLYALFAVLAGYVLWNRPRTFSRLVWHPVFRAAYFMLFVACLVETLHPYATYTIPFRIAQMAIGAVVIATLCRDKAALYAAMYGFILAGIGVSTFLIFKGNRSLHEAMAADYKAATQLRTNTFQTDLHFELGTLAWMAGQGVVVALALALAARSPKQRYLFLFCGLICLVGTFMPLSRGGVLITALSCLTVIVVYLLAHPSKQGRTLIATAVLLATVFVAVPDAVFSRLQFSTEENSHGKMEGRARIYTSAITYLPEYVLDGVGAGNYWTAWAANTTFEKNDFGKIDGPHNCFIVMTVYWGLAGLITFIVVVWRAYLCVPLRHREDTLAICLYGLSVGWFLRLMVVHTLYDKAFSFGFGLLVASSYWIWRKGAARVDAASPGVLPAPDHAATPPGFRPRTLNPG
jgi:hypothetical protein